jgi:transposase-like protein
MRPTSRWPGRWRYLYRAVDQYGQVIDVLLSEQRDTAAARRFFARALAQAPVPVEVTTDKAGAYLRVIDELVPAAAHVTEQYANNLVEADHGRLKAWLRPMRGLKRFRSAARLAAGHAFVQACVVAIANLPLTPHHRSACLLHSPSWHRPCDQYYLQTRRLPRQAGRNRARGVVRCSNR